MTVPSAQAPAEAFVAALATRDYDAMAATMHSDIAFRALLPSRIAEHANAAAVINEMRGWFDDASDFKMLDSVVEHFVDRSRIWFRIQLRDDDGWAVVEQTAFCADDDGGMTLMNLVCSGWRATDDPGTA